jgi:hypothetical protein
MSDKGNPWWRRVNYDPEGRDPIGGAGGRWYLARRQHSSASRA